MSKQSENDREIVVRRTYNVDGDVPHGGIWKIAYADFMTAMMAFFLVLWLISSTDDKTKVAIANFFNPIKLVDMHSSPKGVQSLNSDMGDDDGLDEGSEQAAQERQLFLDPDAALTEILRKADYQNDLSTEGDDSTFQPGAQNSALAGEAYRDPFSPDFWATQRKPLSFSEQKPEHGSTAIEDKSAKAQPEVPAGPVTYSEHLVAKLTNASQGLLSVDKRTVSEALNSPDVKVVAVDGGVLIQLTDHDKYGMFAIGSAKPDARLINTLERIAKVISQQKGEVIISGHTDARPFKGSTYDNWQLSTARAQMVYYMLLRGGLSAQRVLRIEGYADRAPRDGSDPNAAVNRRIDIFLKTRS